MKRHPVETVPDTGQERTGAFPIHAIGIILGTVGWPGQINGGLHYGGPVMAGGAVAGLSAWESTGCMDSV